MPQATIGLMAEGGLPGYEAEPRPPNMCMRGQGVPVYFVLLRSSLLHLSIYSSPICCIHDGGRDINYHRRSFVVWHSRNRSSNLGYSWSTDTWKRHVESENLIAKYRDPLLLAAHDLQFRLFSIVDGNRYLWIEGTKEQKENLRLYTTFLVAQFLSWTYILRRQAQFLRFASSTRDRNKQLASTLALISETFRSDAPGARLEKERFTLWRGQQIAIGEIMTTSDDSYCLGYAAFVHKYKDSSASQQGAVDWELALGCKEDKLPKSKKPEGLRVPSQEFRKWFRPLIESINQVSTARHDGDAEILDGRMRMLQHLLLDLMEVLDVGGAVIGSQGRYRCRKARLCPCKECTKR